MHYKLIARCAMLVGAGAILGWAATADHYEGKIEQIQENHRAERANWRIGTVQEIKDVEGGIEISGTIDSPGAQSELEKRNIVIKGNVVEDGGRKGIDPDEWVSFAHAEAYVGESTEHPDEVIAREQAEQKEAELEEALHLLTGGSTDPELEADSENPQGDAESEVSEADVIDEADEVLDRPDFPPGETEPETRNRLQRIIDQYTADPAQTEQFTDAGYREIEEANNVPPFVISQTAYSWDEEGEAYDKETYRYYPRDRILLDEDEEVIDDVRGVVGWRNLDRFGDESGDPDTVYIRNRRLNTDIEVIRDEDKLPLHIQYGMPREEFETVRASGKLRLREED